MKVVYKGKKIRLSPASMRPPVQKTDRIICADGNPQNLDRGNLIKLTGAEYVAYTNLRGALIEKGNVDPDALRAVITLAKIRSRLREKRKNKV